MDVNARIDAALALAARYRRILTVAAVALIALIGFEALHIVLKQVHLRDVRAALHAIPDGRIAAALGLTVLSYLVLTGLDWVALRTIGRPQPWRIAAAGSFTSYTLSHNFGMAVLTGGSARLRIYGAAGLSLGEVAQVAGIAGVSFWGGIFGAAGIGLLLTPGAVALGPVTVPALAARLIGAGLIAMLAIPPIARARGLSSIGVSRWRMPVPAVRDMATLTGLSLIDLAGASAALFVLVPGTAIGAYPDFLVAYAVAVIVALVLHVPGGLGVFETVVLATVPGDRPTIFAALLLYRLIYYLLPLLIAAIGIAATEGWRLRHPLRRSLGIADRAAQALGPGAVTALVFVAGFVLLVSGALPGVKGRLADLDDLVPLPFIEGSHMAGSLIGTALLLVAPALNARLRSGWAAARALLVGGAIFSLMKGLDWEEALLQLVVAGVLQYCRPSFYRTGGILTDRPRWPWLAAAVAALGLSIWAGFFAYKRTPYADDLWWRFALDGNAPRFLRASFAAGVLLTAASAWQLLTGSRTTRVTDAAPPPAVLDALARAPRADANLAFTGDKSFIVSAAGDAFLMYRVQGRTWTVMGDPIGPVAAWGELAWSIRRACDAAAGRLCVYQASERMLPLFVELGLQPIKYGEEALLPLDTFALAGPRAKPLRHAIRRSEQAGATFSVEPASAVPLLVEELRAVSDAWLAHKKGREKRFSLGAFDPDYLARFPVALVRCQGRIVAFANIWSSGDGAEISVDLMRHLPDAPYGTMEAMMVRLIEWGRAQGYARFNLGMAPLAGLPTGRLAPIWARLGHALFANGERLYGFAGLRAFKAKFGPVWEARYIATPPGVAMPRALLDLARLVSG